MRNCRQSPEVPTLAATMRRYVETLCFEFGNRHVGSSGNQAATKFFAQTLKTFGFDTSCPEFPCLDWEPGSAVLQVDDEPFDVQGSPYSHNCHVTAPLAAASTFEQLEALDVRGKILLLYGKLAQEQYIPKHFPFDIPVAHPDILHYLEQKAPEAIIAATGRNPELAGAMYPFPLIEDGDFAIPSVYMTDVEGKRLLPYCGRTVSVQIDSRRIPATAWNVIGRKGPRDAAKLVFCAHIDAKKATPGALDNATGVAILLALAELLADYSGALGIEIVALNGEDYYSAPGQANYLAQPAAEFERILLAVNLDLVGYREGITQFSFYGCPADMVERIRAALRRHVGLEEGDPWYQGDHMIFAARQRPALAFVSQPIEYLCAEITHTPNDTPELVAYQKLTETAYSLKDIVDVIGI